MRLVAVTKSVGIETIADLAALGVRDFGENRVDALRDKRAAFGAAWSARSPAASTGTAPHVVWHMIGHVQRRKVRQMVVDADVLHAGDRRALFEEIHARRDALRVRPLPVLLQVNVSGEESKGGVRPSEAAELAEEALRSSTFKLDGLMTMAPATANPDDARPVFRRLRALRDGLADRGYLGVGELSMGMSSDFEAAIEEGATIVRLGRTLFSARANN